MEFSKFGEHYSKGSGILDLMDDLGKALSTDTEMLMLGGGNPSHIPEIEEIMKKEMENLLANGDFGKVIGNYDTPQGNIPFLKSLAKMFNDFFGWDLTEKNIALTNGSQNAFFYLFNFFAGDFKNGSKKKILLPLAPEYIGYSDIGLTDDFFVSYKPEIEKINNHTFKYKIDFNNCKITDDIGAVCISRPTNPTGNVLTDAEVAELRKMTTEAGIPLIIDNAYGTPFPNIIYTDATPVWDENIILSMSLSKFGLPAVRTGIVIANEEVIHSLSALNAIASLAPGGIGASLVKRIVDNGSIIDLSKDVVQKYYHKKCLKAFNSLTEKLGDCDFYLHKPEGALFLWLWLPNLPITSDELYERLKKRGVLVISGSNFFPGLNEDWQHKNECIRITYAQNDDIVERGLAIIADEIKNIKNIKGVK